MKRLRDLEEWQTIQIIRPSVRHILRLVSNELNLSEHIYYNSLVDLREELEVTAAFNSLQILPTEDDVGKSRFFLRSILTLLEELLNELSVLQVPSSTRQIRHSERAFGNYPTLKRLAQFSNTSEVGPTLASQIQHSELGKILSIKAAQVITQANKFIGSITRHSDIDSKNPFVEEVARTINVEFDHRIPGFASTVLEDIQSRFSECGRRTFVHDILFTLPGPESPNDNISGPQLNLLLRSCAEVIGGGELWQETTCHCYDPFTNHGGSEHNQRPTPIHLCEAIEEHLSVNRSLHLTLQNHKVNYYHHSEGMTGLSETITCPSLGDLLKDGCFLPIDPSSTNRFKDLEKRTLALKLSYLFSYMYDCKLTANRWTAIDVHVATSPQQNMLRSPPYVKCSNVGKDDKQGDVSAFVSLAKLLIEIELGEEIKESHLRRNGFGAPGMILTLYEKLNSVRMSKIPYYSRAVEECLSLAERHGRSDSMRHDILDKVVRNLEIELTLMIKRQSRAPLPLPLYTGIAYTPRNTPATRYLGPDPVNSTQELNDRNPRLATVNHSEHKISIVQMESPRNNLIVPRAGTTSSGQDGLFDDLAADNSNEKLEKYARGFFKLYEEFHKDMLANQSPESSDRDPAPRISVCIIDTGIDMKHPAIIAGKQTGAIKESRCRSWIGPPDEIHDSYGHGTHMVELILRSSKNVDMYIAKIAHEAQVPDNDIGLIADAINHAVKVWNVDIITMSFGFKKSNKAVAAAVKEAAYHGTLMFAAASNQGGNGGRTYPAKYRDVICISASDGNGKDGGISPAAADYDDNFMTLGMSVPLLWKGTEVLRSGTSFATPIAVGLAINVLAICGNRLETSRNERDMRAVLRLFSTKENNYNYIAPWILLDECRDFGHMVDRIVNTFQL